MAGSEDRAAQGPVTHRFSEIDAWKAAGILVVVLIHAMRARWDPSISDAEIWLGFMTRFGVPTFCAASGFLYASVSAGTPDRTRTRVRRILLPYLIASTAAFVFRAARGADLDPIGITRDLALAAAFGHYYYVWIALCFVWLTPLFARLGPGALAICLLVAFPIQGALDTFVLTDVFWHARNPLAWLAYFLAGWCIRIHYAAITARVVRHRSAFVLAFAAVIALQTGVSGAVDSRLVARFGTWLTNYAVLGLVFCAVTGRSGVSRPVRWLSDAGYTLYLWHPFALTWLHARFPQPRGELDLGLLAATWIAGLSAGALVVALGRSLLGSRSRDWIGA